MAVSILVFGEILYDLFEEKAEIGGAPFNFAAHFASLGGKAEIVSALGKDALGDRALAELAKRNVGSRYTARVDYPTGSCKVTLKDGVPSYDLVRNTAYDHIPPVRPDEPFDALYFGTLAQRETESAFSLRALLSVFSGTVFYDVNVRKPFCTKEQIEKSLPYATIVKISREEAGELFPYTDPEAYCAAVLAAYPKLQQVVLTLDKDGSILTDREKGCFRSPKPSSKAVSTVGAGDSFGACYLYHYLKGDEPQRCLQAATALSDYVVTQLGAVPPLPESLRNEIL